MRPVPPFSVAATVSQWAARNVRHGVRSPRSGAGSMPCSRRILAMVLLATVWPRFERAPRMRRIPPPRIRLRHPYDKLANLGHDPGPSGLFPPLAVVPLPRNQPSVPSQQGFRCDDTGDFCQEFPTKRLTLYREPTSLGVRQAKLLPAKPSFEDFVLLEQVDNSGLLVTLEPTSDGDDQQGQGLDWRAHDRGF